MASSHAHFTLDNGLTIYVIHDPGSSQAVTNLLYHVGSKDEDPEKTGFAHLFEHLMFGGSQHIANFDKPLQRVGGNSNAFTSPDITNYYIQLPAVNLETAFWLESDRMLSLSFDPRVLEVQRSVVIEEFKQRYLNQPYGDLWMKFRPMAYQQHGYRWATIGKEIRHIEEATMEDVRGFFTRYYHPGNATLVVGGPTPPEEVKRLAEKWFGPIPAGVPVDRSGIFEPKQTEARTLHTEAKVPVRALYKGYHMARRFTPEYHSTDLLSDVLGRGESARLYQKLVIDKPTFSSVSAFVMGSIDPGLLVIQGRLLPEASFEQAEEGIQSVVDSLVETPVHPSELLKVKNQAESTLVLGQVELLNQCMALAFAAHCGRPEYPEQESGHIQAVTVEGVHEMAQEVLRVENSSTLLYDIQK